MTLRRRLAQGGVVLTVVPALALGVAPAPPQAQAAGPLAGEVVVLDPGHDGANAARPEIIGRQVYAGNGIRKACNTTGTHTAGGYQEHAFTWGIARRVAIILRDRGARVVVTRPTDNGVGPCIDVRARTANQSGAHAVVSIHADGNLSAGPAAYARATGIPYADHLAGGDAPDHRSDLGGLNLSTRPIVFVEAGNMRNRDDAAVFTSPDGRRRIANGLTNHLRG